MRVPRRASPSAGARWLDARASGSSTSTRSGTQPRRSRLRTACRHTWSRPCSATPLWRRRCGTTRTSPTPLFRRSLTRLTPGTAHVCALSQGRMGTGIPKPHTYQQNKSAEKGNRTLPSLLKAIGSSAVQTRGNGHRTPRDAVPGQRYWPSTGPAPSKRHEVQSVPASGERTLGWPRAKETIERSPPLRLRALASAIPRARPNKRARQTGAGPSNREVDCRVNLGRPSSPVLTRARVVLIQNHRGEEATQH